MKPNCQLIALLLVAAIVGAATIYLRPGASAETCGASENKSVFESNSYVSGDLEVNGKSPVGSPARRDFLLSRLKDLAGNTDFLSVPRGFLELIEQLTTQELPALLHELRRLRLYHMEPGIDVLPGG